MTKKYRLEYVIKCKYDRLGVIKIGDNTDFNKVLVKKNNRYIRCTLCFSDTQEKKIILLAISKIDKYKAQGIIKEDKPIPIDFYLTASEIREFLGTSSKDLYSQLESTASKITSRKMEYDDGESFAFVVPFPYATYKDSVFHLRSEVSMFNTLVNYTENGGFTQYVIANVKNLRGTYSIATYELLRSYLYLGEVEISVEEYKKNIGVIEAVPKNPKRPFTINNRVIVDKFPVYGDLKRKVITKAQKELAQYTDITFDFEELKVGKKVTTLKFTIKKNNKGVQNRGIVEYKRTRVLIPKELQKQAKDLKDFLPKTIKNNDILELLSLGNNNVEEIRKVYKSVQNRGGIQNKINYTKKILKEQNKNKAVESSYSHEIKCDDEICACEQISLNLGQIQNYTPNTTNKFNKFPQRDYSKQQLSELEKRLLEK